MESLVAGGFGLVEVHVLGSVISIGVERPRRPPAAA